MNANQEVLEKQFARLSDDELVSRVFSGDLTEFAQGIALAEARSRNLPVPDMPNLDQSSAQEPEYHGDMQIVAKYLTPTEAHMLCSCLQSAGIPADAGDTHMVQAYSILTNAIGGACVRVPTQFVAEANEVIAAFKRGEFQLDDDFDVGA